MKKVIITVIWRENAVESRAQLGHFSIFIHILVSKRLSDKNGFFFFIPCNIIYSQAVPANKEMHHQQPHHWSTAQILQHKKSLSRAESREQRRQRKTRRDSHKDSAVASRKRQPIIKLSTEKCRLDKKILSLQWKFSRVVVCGHFCMWSCCCFSPRH
jgi:hypothetical protein